MLIYPDLLSISLHSKHHIREFAHRYAHEFCKRLIMSHPPIAAWPSDMGVPGTDWSKFVIAFPDIKVEVSLQAVHRLRFHLHSAKDRRDALQELEQKILAGLADCL